MCVTLTKINLRVEISVTYLSNKLILFRVACRNLPREEAAGSGVHSDRRFPLPAQQALLLAHAHLGSFRSQRRL